MMNGYGMGAGAWLIMAVVWVALIAVIVWAVATLASRGRTSDETPDAGDGPQEILDRRLASGEIDPATYDDLRGRLQAAHPARG
jgi:putative membrane protein